VIAWRARVITRDQLRHLPHFMVMSVLATSFYYYGFVAGTDLLPSSVAGLLSGAIPIFTFLSAAIFLRDDRPTQQMAAGVALGFAGIVLSARPWDSAGGVDPLGVLWMMAGTLSLGVSFVYARRFLSPLRLPPLALATWQTGLAVLTLMVMTDFDGINAITADAHALWGAIIGLGALGTGGAFLIYYFIIERLGPVRAAGATYIAPLIAVIIGAAMGEAVTAIELIALALILGGVVLIQSGKQRGIPDAQVKAT
jgi:drug/metabolite transporter (DMT)-like permease